MSAQGATLDRGTAHLPIWPVAGLVVVAVVAAIGLRMIGDAGRDAAPQTSTGVFESTTALREQGAIPAVDPSLIFESSTALRELGLVAVPAVDRGLIFESTTAVREGAPFGVTYIHGLENAGAYQANAIPGKAAPHDPIVAAGEPCPQCR